MSEEVALVPWDRKNWETLDWVQPSAFGRKYELECGGQPVARIAFQSLFGTMADARTVGEHWTFKRSGIFTPIVSARDGATGEEVARYEPNWSGTKGKLILGSGEEAQLRTTNFWGTQWGVYFGGDSPDIQFEAHGVMGTSARVALSESAKDRADLHLLLAFSFYVLVLHQLDGAAVAAAGS